MPHRAERSNVIPFRRKEAPLKADPDQFDWAAWWSQKQEDETFLQKVENTK